MRFAATLGLLALLVACGATRKAASPPPPKEASPAPTQAAKPRLLVVGPHNAPVPILMYHVIARAPAGAPNPGLFVPTADFRAQVAWLVRNGYHAVTLKEVYDYWLRGYALPRKPVVLSFDDGYLNDYTDALPILRGRSWPGVLNLEVHNVIPGDLTPYQVRSLIRAGWEIDAHTLTHPDLRTLGDARLTQEVAGSRAWIRQHFGVPVDFFCYPAGKYDARVVRFVRAAGYLAATTVNYGLASPRQGLFTLARVRIDASDGLGGFAAKLLHAGPRSVTAASAGGVG